MRGEYYLAEPQVAVVPGGCEAHPPEGPHDAHLPHGDVPHVVTYHLQLLKGVPSSHGNH